MIINNRLLSFKNFIPEAWEVIKRFPFVIFYFLVIVVTAVINIEWEPYDQSYIFINIIKSAVLGIPLAFIFKLYGEKNNWSVLKDLISNAIILIILILHYFSLPDSNKFLEVYELRFGLFCLIAFSLVTFLPFKGKDKLNGFWQYNKSLVFDYLFAHISTGILVGGILLAILALDKLFELNFDEKIYGETAIIIAGIFFPLLFLSNIPKRLDEFRESTDYPKIIKIFTQFILMPLVVIYFVILFAYELKIVIQWNWPNGWVSLLVIWYAILGLATNVLLFPIKDDKENIWFKRFFTWFFISLIPFIVMLFFAISTRISDYGITENRYFVYAIAVALSVLTLYFLFSKVKNIRMIPVVIFILAAVSTYGPQSAFSVSKNDQKARLKQLLIDNNLMVDDKIVKASGVISFEDRQSIGSKIKYLVRTHGIESIHDWYADFDLTKLDTTTRTEYVELVELIGFKYVSEWDTETSDYVTLRNDDLNIIDIASYDYLLLLDKWNLGFYNFAIDDRNYEVIVNRDSLFLKFSELDEKLLPTQLALISFADTLNNYIKANNTNSNWKIEFDGLTIEQTSDHFDLKLILDRTNGNLVDETFKPNNLHGYLLIRRK